MKTPELDKMLKVREDSQQIGEFLEWLAEQEYVLAEWTGSDCCDECGNEPLMEMSINREKLLAKYFDINLAKCEAERQAIFDDLKAKNNESEVTE
jgi:hypothetical protein